MLDVELYSRLVGDHLDRILEQWARERPDLDPTAMATFGRIARAARFLEREMGDVFASFGLNRGEFDVLASLRRSGSPFRLTPTSLSGSLLLSTGAMTNRIDRLEEDGLVARRADPYDRRGVLVELTPAGRDLVDRALAAHVANEERMLGALSLTERGRLAGLLRKLLTDLETTGERHRSTTPARV